MSNIKERRKARFDKSKITKSDDLYDSKDPSVDISSEELPDIPKNETIEITEKPNRKTKRRRDLLVKEYDYQKMAVEYSLENVSQQLHNYRCAMEFLAHVNLTDNDTIVDRFKEIIYNYPNVDMSTFANKDNAKLYSWIVQQMIYVYGQKYIGVVYLLGGGMGLLGSMLLDTKMRFENIRSFDINGTCQFLADEFHKKELLQDWKFKSNTQDLFEVNYIENEFQTRLADGKLSTPYNEIPGTIINCSVSYLTNFQDWYDMIPDTKRVVLVGETGDVPRPFPSSQNFNLRFPMSYEQYSGVITVGSKQFFLKMGLK
jgi:hypothetical protein|tara:strand:+ start:6848 stop:7792 length:945 start_codon:yes stop_codon:yes gene_type:complete